VTTAIDVDGVSVSLGGVTVLDAVSTTVEDAQFVGLVGPNGAGKTTLLRTINGALDPDEGAVHVAGADVSDIGSRATSRLVATVPQSTAVAFEFPVRHVVEMGRTPHIGRFGTRTAADREAVDAAMERAAVTDLADRPVTEVSGGERQRVFLARALAQDTPVLLLDEPTSDLDPRNTGLIEEAIAEACARDIGVVVATHDMHQAERIADRVGVLLGDGFSEVGPTETIFEHPTDERTRKFISGELVY
jgi:iron complex transport system ATP-binding protein